MNKNTSPQTHRQCQCGCSGSPKKGRYIPGHDAKHLSDLLKKALNNDLDARAHLKALRWESFLHAREARLLKVGKVPEKSMSAVYIEPEQIKTETVPRIRSGVTKKTASQKPKPNPPIGGSYRYGLRDWRRVKK